MNAFQIEAWAHRVIKCVETGQPDEDFKVELKSDWPNPQKAARRIAAHANAARGEPIIWLVGVDEKNGTVVGASPMEVSTWYEQVKAEFDERIAPTMKDLNIPYNGKTVVALFFETERFPFVVKTIGEKLEVPWREGTATRSAKRSELLKLLVPLQNLPGIEVLDGEVRIEQNNIGEKWWRVQMQLYIEPQRGVDLTIPFHRCRASLEVTPSNIAAALGGIRLYPRRSSDKNFYKTIEATYDELLVYGPGRVNFSASAAVTSLPSDLNHDAQINACLLPVGAEHPASFIAILSKSLVAGEDRSTLHVWKLKK